MGKLDKMREQGKFTNGHEAAAPEKSKWSQK
jgi:hypothetical protein